MRNQNTAGWILVCAAAATVAGCGSSGSSGSSGSKTVPKADIISKGDAICQKANSQVTANPPNSDPARATPAQLKAYAPFFQQVSSSVQTSISQIAALGKPDKDAALLDRLLVNGRASAASNKAIAQAAQSGDVKAFKAAAAARPPSGTALAKQFGFKVCAQHS